MRKKENQTMKRVLVVSDFHCGHEAGLWMGSPLWNKFVELIRGLGKIDICVANGDLIDGKGPKTGGTELITADRFEQAEMALRVLEFINANVYRLTYGTAYHTGYNEDWEDIIAKRIGATIKGHDFFDVNGLVFDVKHKIRGSSIPHGRFSPLARAKLWNLFWNEFHEVPRADIFIRSHVHYLSFCGGKKWLALTTPALQDWGSKYGERECENVIDWGFVYFDILDRNCWSWKDVTVENHTVKLAKL